MLVLIKAAPRHYCYLHPYHVDAEKTEEEPEKKPGLEALLREKPSRVARRVNLRAAVVRPSGRFFPKKFVRRTEQKYASAHRNEGTKYHADVGVVVALRCGVASSLCWTTSDFAVSVESSGDRAYSCCGSRGVCCCCATCGAGGDLRPGVDGGPCFLRLRADGQQAVGFRARTLQVSRPTESFFRNRRTRRHRFRRRGHGRRRRITGPRPLLAQRRREILAESPAARLGAPYPLHGRPSALSRRRRRLRPDAQTHDRRRDPLQHSRRRPRPQSSGQQKATTTTATSDNTVILTLLLARHK